MIRLSVILLLFLSCGVQKYSDSVIKISPSYDFGTLGKQECSECQIYKDQFEDDLNVSARGLPIYLTNLEGARAGVCYQYDSGEGVAVVIDNQIWQKLTTSSRKVLIYHELGHCLLNRSHRDELMTLIDSAGNEEDLVVPRSLMFSNIFTAFKAAYAVANWQEYIQELEGNENFSDNIDFERVNRQYFEDLWGHSGYSESEEGLKVTYYPFLRRTYFCYDNRYIFSSPKFEPETLDELECE